MRIRAVDEEGQQPLQPVLSWEVLVDRLADSRLYMELAGQRSGLGRLFIDHQQQIIGLFKSISFSTEKKAACSSLRT